MIRFPLPFLSQLSTSLVGLMTLSEGTVGDHAQALFTAEFQLGELLHKSVFKDSLRSSRPLADDLLGLIRTLTADFDFDKKIEQYQASHIRNTYEQLKIALLAELGSFSAYFVTSKAGFDINALLENPERLFPETLQRKVPESLFDVREASRCLAYELPTATGFHAFRAVEAVLRRYYAHVTSGAVPPKTRSMKVYTKAMRRCQTGDEKVLSALDHLADLHRNPLAHPEDNLTLDDAIDIIGLARSIISAMLRELPEPAQPTASTEKIGLLGAFLTPNL